MPAAPADGRAFQNRLRVVAPDLVVAAGKNLEARTALRKGTDAAERSAVRRHRSHHQRGVVEDRLLLRPRGLYSSRVSEDLEASDLETRRTPLSERRGFALSPKSDNHEDPSRPRQDDEVPDFHSKA